jgi:hypothetical protein
MPKEVSKEKDFYKREKKTGKDYYLLELYMKEYQ